MALNEIEKAELIQGLKAYLIPSSLFVACLLGAAGTFLVREGYALGWGVIGLAALIIVSAFVAFVRFQNKLRAGGVMPEQKDVPAPDFESVQYEKQEESELKPAQADSPAEAART